MQNQTVNKIHLWLNPISLTTHQKVNKNSLNIAITHEKRHIIKPKNIHSSINRNKKIRYFRGLKTKQKHHKKKEMFLLYLWFRRSELTGRALREHLWRFWRRTTKASERESGFLPGYSFLCFFSNPRVRDGQAEQEQLLGLGLEEVGFDWTTWRTVKA